MSTPPSPEPNDETSFNVTTKSSSTPTCKLPGWFYLATVVFLYSLKANIFKLLTVYKPTVFNTCNILCASNTITLIASIIYLRKDLTLESAKSIPHKTWLWMGANALLYSVLGPFFFNNGLTIKNDKNQSLDVATVAVLAQSQSVFLILAAPILSKCTKIPPKWDLFNTFLVALGILFAILSNTLFFNQIFIFETGQLYILISAVCYTGSLLINKDQLKHVPPGIFTVFKYSIGTIVFHLIAVAQGRDKWQTLIDSELWV